MRAAEDIVFCWDGRILELFERGPSYRLHCDLIAISQKGPDRKGRYLIEISNREGGRLRARPDNFTISLWVDASHFPDVLALIQEVNAARGV